MQAAGAGGGAGGPDDGREGQAGRVPGQPYIPGPGGDASSATGRSDTLVHRFALCVPFPCNMEAEVAYASLAPDHQMPGNAVELELSMFGSILAVRWRAESRSVLRASIISFLEQLSMVMETLQRVRAPTAR